MINKIVHLVLLISLVTCFIQEDLQAVDNFIPTLLQNSLKIPLPGSDGHSSFNHFQIHAPVLDQKINDIDMERPKHKRIQRIQVEIEKILKKNFVIFKDSEIQRIEKIGHIKKQPLYEIVLLSNQKSYSIKVTYNQKRQQLKIIEINQENNEEGKNQQEIEQDKEVSILDEALEVLKYSLENRFKRARFSTNLINSKLNLMKNPQKVVQNDQRFQLKSE